MEPKVELTVEQIEHHREHGDYPYTPDMSVVQFRHALCDLALSEKEMEEELKRKELAIHEMVIGLNKIAGENVAMREAIKLAVEDIDVMLGVIVEDGYIHPRLKKLRADLEQSLNPKNEVWK